LQIKIDKYRTCWKINFPLTKDQLSEIEDKKKRKRSTDMTKVEKYRPIKVNVIKGKTDANTNIK